MSFMKEFEHLKIKLVEINKATNSFSNKVIGKGGFGSVYKGEVPHSKGRNLVAIKRLDRQFGQGDPEFLKELMMLSRYTHQHLISLLGYCDEDGEKILVYEYASNGSLDQHLSDPGLSWTQRLKICIGAAKGLSYLHDPNGTHQRVLHCDIKSANILLDENFIAKVADFGLAKLCPANQQYSVLFTNARGTFGYCDPLYMMTYALTKESDIYSFGVVLFEVLCGRLCSQLNRGQLKVFVPMWKKSYTEKKLKEIIFQELVQQMDPTSLEIFSNVAFQCLQNSREERPTMSNVLKKLELALESHELHNSNAQFSEDLSGTHVANHEPVHWSYFTRLEQNEFSKKDNVSLIDQDHPKFSSRLSKVNEESFVDAEEAEKDATLVTTWSESVSGYDPSQVEISENIQFSYMVENMRIAYLENETYLEKAEFPSSDLPLGDFDITSLQIIRNDDLEELRELGSGKFETVYHGKWRGTDVAIKRINKSFLADQSNEKESLTIEFWREATIHSKLNHPNIVAFYGVVRDGPGGTLASITEFMVNGSLRDVLVRKDRHLDFHMRRMIALDVAVGMEYIHSKNIVHFDLKCDNLLVNMKDPSRPICKVDNFGLSEMKRNTFVSGGVRGTLPWMAPELLNGSNSKVSEKVDVFSFGIVLWEILTGEEPYANMHYGEIIGGIASNTLRPPIPNYCDDEWRKLMEQCWAPNPMVRPSFTEIMHRLGVMSATSLNKGHGLKGS